MIELLLFLFLLVSICVAIHGAGTLLILHWLNGMMPAQGKHLSLFAMFWVLVRMVYGLLLMHLLEILVWALCYQWRGCFPDFETSFYYSATCYSTAGFGDVIPGGKWRIVGSLEAVTGILMFGWSTGVLFSVVNQLFGHFKTVRIVGRPGPGK